MNSPFTARIGNARGIRRRLSSAPGDIRTLVYDTLWDALEAEVRTVAATWRRIQG
jgi:hypothetical protein